jgi:dolichol kinase
MVLMALTVLAVFVILVGCELWWQKHEADDEFSRKTVHITIGSFVAFWPFFLSWGQIELLSIAFLLVVSISKYLHLFEAIHSVQRPTWGELFFAAAVGIVALISQDKWIYAASLLQMSLADGLAAIVGTRFGGRHKYLVFGHPKSLIGTATFFVVSLVILIAFSPHLGPSLGIGLIVGTSLLASMIENVGINGADNLLVPLVVALILSNS